MHAGVLWASEPERQGQGQGCAGPMSCSVPLICLIRLKVGLSFCHQKRHHEYFMTNGHKQVSLAIFLQAYVSAPCRTTFVNYSRLYLIDCLLTLPCTYS